MLQSAQYTLGVNVCSGCACWAEGLGRKDIHNSYVLFISACSLWRRWFASCASALVRFERTSWSALLCSRSLATGTLSPTAAPLLPAAPVLPPPGAPLPWSLTIPITVSFRSDVLSRAAPSMLSTEVG